LLKRSKRDPLARFISERFAAGTPCSYADAWSFLDIEFNIQIPMDTMRDWVRGLQGFKVVKGILIEAERSACAPMR
jgi:hypothetical protein